jgi:hypothetical protein
MRAALIATICGVLLAACYMEKHVTHAPLTTGVVIDGVTGAPVAGAVLDYPELATEGLDDGARAVSDMAGRFTLPRLEGREWGIVLPASGVMAAQTLVRARHDAYADGYTHAYYLTGLDGQAAGVAVALFDAPADLPPAVTGAESCAPTGAARHALTLAAHGADIAQSPWFHAMAAADWHAAFNIRQFTADALNWHVMRPCDLSHEARQALRALLAPLDSAIEAASPPPTAR